MDRSFTFKILHEEHLAATASLFNLVFSKNARGDDFLWKYRPDKFGRYYAVQAVDPENNIVAHVGAVPLDGFFYGQRIPFFQFADAMVHPNNRGKNTLTRMIDLLFEQMENHHDRFFPYVFPGPVSSKIGIKYGWLELLKSIEHATIHLQDKYTFTKRLYLSLEKVENFDSVFDTLWDKNKKYYPISLVRDSDFLIWRYRNNPFCSYEVYLLKRFWKPFGWVVVSTPRNGPLRIVDYLFPPDKLKEVLQCLGRELKASSLLTWIPELFKDQLFSLKVEFEKSAVDLCIVKYSSLNNFPAKGTLLKDFYYTRGDIDIY